MCLAFDCGSGKVNFLLVLLNMNPYKWSFIVFLTTAVCEVVGDSGEYVKKLRLHAFQHILLEMSIVNEK